jgi:hypothetical protein
VARCGGCHADLATPAERALAAAMAQFWANFAASGNPNLGDPGRGGGGGGGGNHSGGVRWPAFTAAAGEPVMHLGHGGQTGALSVVQGLRQAQCDFWDELAYPLFPRYHDS